MHTLLQPPRGNFLFGLLLLSVWLALSAEAHRRCVSNCEFDFCAIQGPKGDPVPDVDGPTLLRAPGRASYPFICRLVKKDSQHVRITSTGEAEVYQLKSPSRRVRISQWTPIDLPAPNPAFSPNYFDVFSIPLSLPGFGQSVGRRESVGNQASLVEDLCVKIPIRSYDILEEDSKSLINTWTPGKITSRSCIAFQTCPPNLLADFYWKKTVMVGTPFGQELVSVNLFLTDKKKRRLFNGTETGNPTKCVGCQTFFWKKTDPGVYRIGYSIQTIRDASNPTVVRDYTNGRSHDCPSHYSGGRQVITSPPSPITTKVEALLVLTLGGEVLRKPKKIPFTLTLGQPPRSNFFPGKIRIRPEDQTPPTDPIYCVSNGRKFVCEDGLCKCNIRACDCDLGERPGCLCPAKECTCDLL